MDIREASLIANISFDSLSSYTGTPVPTDYQFVCWVGDENEKELLDKLSKGGREFIQVACPRPITKLSDTELNNEMTRRRQIVEKQFEAVVGQELK